MLIAMAGPPGTGKSTLARCLAAEVKGIVLDKDVVRAALFPLEYIEYSVSQDDLVVDCMLQTAVYIFNKYPGKAVFIDGRPFSRRHQIEAVAEFAAKRNEPFRIIECVASDESVRRRIEQATADDNHPAKNRSFELYLETKGRFHPITLPKLLVNTDQDIEVCVAQCLAYMREQDPA